MKNLITVLLSIIFIFLLYLYYFMSIPDFSSENTIDTTDTIDINNIEIISQKTGVKDDTLNIYEIKLIDKFDNPLKKFTATKVSTAFFSPLYVGAQKKEILLTYKPGKKEITDYELEKKCKYPTPKKMQIFIDTTRTIGTSMGIFEYYKKPEYRKPVLSYPVFIKNYSQDTVTIGFGNLVSLIIEAKDKNGAWKPIQKDFMYDCGTGLSDICLKPNEIAITSMNIFEGKYKTKLRLVLGSKCYSNEITGSINYSQFKK